MMVMRPWMVGLALVWISALGLSAYVLQATSTTSRQLQSTAHQAASDGSAEPHRGLGGAPPASKAARHDRRVLQGHQPSLTVTPPHQSNAAQAPSASWQPVVQQVFSPEEPISAQEVDAIKAAITPVSETERHIDRAKAWEAVNGNPLQIMQEASLLPAFEGGRLVGVTLRAVPEGGILRQSGFQAGDIIRTINGEPLTDPSAVLNLPKTLQEAGEVAVQVERRGRPLTLTYHLQ